jgi:hypothetical protein
MNTNPYPQGRWTQLVANAASKKSRNRLMSESVSSLVEAPLRELFWGLPESRLLDEAKQRIENVVNAAMSVERMTFVEEQSELAVA